MNVNQEILNTYGIDFEILVIQGEKNAHVNQKVISDVSYSLSNYLNEQKHLEFLENEILIDIENAIQGNSFDPDGGGVTMFLKIGSLNSVFSDLGSSSFSASIPTSHLKDIIMSWIDFLMQNKLNK